MGKVLIAAILSMSKHISVMIPSIASSLGIPFELLKKTVENQFGVSQS